MKLNEIGIHIHIYIYNTYLFNQLRLLAKLFTQNNVIYYYN